MCKWGTYQPVEVTVHESIAASGVRHRAVRKIDACIADLVRALDSSGIIMLGSCCGHGKAPGQILLADGRSLTITKRCKTE
jgi:hypothetical protein